MRFKLTRSRRFAAVIISALLCILISAAAADTGYETCYEDFMANAVNGKPQILYTGKTTMALSMRSGPSKETQALGSLKSRETVYIFGYDQTWLFCWDDEVGAYYIGRHNVDTIEPIPGVTEPYGVIRNRYVAYTSKDTVLRASPDANAEMVDSYPAGTRISFWHIKDGWAVMPYKRLIGYIYVGDLTDLTPVAPDVNYAKDGDIISAFTTHYSIAKTELNVGRMENLSVGCRYISKTYEPGEVLDFNKTAGPYRKSRGYMPSPVLIDGGTVAGYGGGTCQVSTTLYNALLQLWDGATIIYRRPHGPGGAKYAPHGVDAAVGADNLNLIFRNDYDFPISIECTVLNGSLCICIRKGAYNP